MKSVVPFLLSVIFISTTWSIDQAKITAEVLSKGTTSWDGSSLPSYPKGQPEITILKVTIPGQTTLKWHKHPIINAGYMLKGELKVESENNDVLYLKPGDTIVELIDTWHHGVNESDKPVEIIVFYAGEVGSPLSIIKED